MRPWPTAVQLLSNNLVGNYVTPSRSWESNPRLSRHRCSWTIIGRQTMRYLRFQRGALGSYEFPAHITLSNRVLLRISLSQAQCFVSDLSGSSLYRSPSRYLSGAETRPIRSLFYSKTGLRLRQAQA